MTKMTGRLLLLAGLWLVLVVPVAADTPCNAPGNLTYNCKLDNFIDRTEGGSIKHIPDGWWFFVLQGDPEMRSSIDTLWGAPSQELWSDGTPFIAGIYQQVKVTPGVVYKTNIGWAAPTKPDFERRLGLDPTGGTDPMAPSVIWGPSSWEVTPMPDLTATARAQGDTMTVFAWVNHTNSHGRDQVFLDDIGLWPDPNAPAATVTPPPTPTPSPRPPTLTPIPAPPTTTPEQVSPTEVVEATVETPAAPTDTPTLAATDTPAPPTATPTATDTPAPPPTRTPTPTPTVTITPVPVEQIARAAPERPDVGSKGGNGQNLANNPEKLLLTIAMVAVLGTLVLLASAIIVWLVAQVSNNKEGEREQNP